MSNVNFFVRSKFVYTTKKLRSGLDGVDGSGGCLLLTYFNLFYYFVKSTYGTVYVAISHLFCVYLCADKVYLNEPHDELPR